MKVPLLLLCLVFVTTYFHSTLAFVITAKKTSTATGIDGTYECLKDGAETGISFEIGEVRWANKKSKPYKKSKFCFQKNPAGTLCYAKHAIGKVEGGTENLLSKETLQAQGLSDSDVKVFKKVAVYEAGARYNTINTYDFQIVTWGINQNSCKGGSLGRVIEAIKNNANAEYTAYFAANGFEVPGRKKVGFKGKQGKDACYALRNSPDAMCVLAVAGNVESVAVQQVRTFVSNVIDKVRNRQLPGLPHRIKEYIKSEYAMFAYVYLKNWMPVYAFGGGKKKEVPWLVKFINTKGASYKNPSTWTTQTEKELVEFIRAERAKEKNRDTYKNDGYLSEERGSYQRGTPLRTTTQSDDSSLPPVTPPYLLGKPITRKVRRVLNE